MAPRNLLLISFDTLRFDALSCAPDRRLLGEDAPLARTPALDSVAAQGTLFARAVTTCCYTSPSHASIFTGTYWPRHGVLDLFRYSLSDGVETLAEALRDRGWQTAQNAGRGWRNGDMFAKDFVGLNRGYQFHAFGGWMRRKGLRWLRRADARGRWFLFWHTMAAHRPYGRSHRLFRRLLRRDLEQGTPFVHLRRLYLRNVTDIDRRFGRLWQRWRRDGLLDDTLVVIMSDHGEGLSPHCTIHCNPGGWSEGVCRVPILMWAPGVVKAGQVFQDPVSTVDVAPTVAELLEMDWSQPGGFDGVSLAAAARGESPPSALRKEPCFTFASMSDGPPPIMQALVEGTWKYVAFAPPDDLRWTQLERNVGQWQQSARKQSRWYNTSRLLGYHRRGEHELLFETASDPHETNNLAHQCPELL